MEGSWSKEGFALGVDGRPVTEVGGSGVDGTGDSTPLEGKDITLYRSVTARFLFLSQAGPDIVFAVRECTKHMANPTV